MTGTIISDSYTTGIVLTTTASNPATVTDASGQHARLHIAGTTFSSANIQFASDGSTGTDVSVGPAALGHTLSSTYTSTVTLTSPTNNPLTVLSSGKVVPTALTGGYGGLYAKGGANQTWTITNSGLINDGANGNGIQLGQGGTYVGASLVVNATGGTIIGAYGIRMYNTVASRITNQSGGTIEAISSRGVYFNATSTLTNYGVITAPTLTNQQFGVLMENGGVLINGATGTISGYGGVVLIGTSTVTNAGTIEASATNHFAVQLGVGVGNKLIVDPGSVFVGQVSGGYATLELASATGAGTLTATNFAHFDFVKFDAGSNWTLIGNAPSNVNSSTALAGTISGFTSNDTIDLLGFTATSASYAGGALTLTNASNGHTTLHFSGGPFNTGTPQLTTNASGTDVVVGTSASFPTLDYGNTTDETGIVAASETVTAGAMTLFNSGSSAVGTINVGTSLSTGDFTLASANGGTGTDVIVNTVFGTYTSGVTLLTNPTTIASTARITGTVASGIGVTGPVGTTWTLTNAGTVSESGTGSIGISLATAATITNAAGGNVAGAQTGVSLAAGGLVNNQSGGSITGDIAVYVKGAAATVVNYGGISGGTVSDGYGVLLSKGGTITNASGGTISGYQGIEAFGAATTLVNSGLLSADPAHGMGIYLADGGAVINQSGATIAGSYGVYAISVPITVVNAGSIHSMRLKGGSVTNQASGAIVGSFNGVYESSIPLTLVNVGSIGATSTYSTGANLVDGGRVTNQSGGIIFGGYAIRAQALTTVINAGSIQGNATVGAGVYFSAGGALTNQSGGTITADRGVFAVSAASTLLNTGAVIGNASAFSGRGVSFAAGGLVSNQSGGVITGLQGVYIGGGTGSVVNAGSIGGNTATGIGVYLHGGGTITGLAAGIISGGADAVKFASGFTNRLVVDPGAGFTGTVDGGNTIGGTSISTLELASGASAGTLSGLGTQFISFARDTIDAGTNWIFSGANTLVTGATLSNAGTLTDTGTFFNSGTLTGNHLKLAGGVLTNQAGGLVTSASAYSVYGAATGGADAVVNQGTISNSQGLGFGVYLAGAGNVSNAAGAMIGGYSGVKLKGVNATLSNLGQITGFIASSGPSSYGVYLRNGGVITNGQATGSTTSTASIQGYYGLAFKTVDTINAIGTLVNYGTVRGTGTAEGDGALLSNSGTVLNGQSGATAALIEGYRFGISSGAGPVTNDATIIATGFAVGTAGGDYGVAISDAGSVGNLGTASLIEGYGGVQIGLDGTVINAGTIESNQGASGVAVDFTGGDARLIDDPGAVFVGSIFGGTGGTAVLELASGASAGTIYGLGTTVTNFTSLVFDAGAAWTVGGDDSMEGLGTLGISGFTIGDTIDLSGFVATSKTFGSNALVLSDGSTTETLNIQGAFSTSNFTIASDGSTGTDITFGTGVAALVYGETIDETGIVAASETVTAGVMTLFNGGATAVGTITVGTSLSTGDFMLASANGGTGTDVIVDTVFGAYPNGVTLLVNPTTIASTAVVSNAADGGIAVTGPTGTIWTVTNLGTVTESGAASFGVSLGSGGTVVNAGLIASDGYSAVYIQGAGSVTNLSGGTISDTSDDGVKVGGAGNLTNNGTIDGAASAIYVLGFMTVTNTGVLLGTGANSLGADLRGGGVLSNSASGSISGSNVGVDVKGVQSTIVNDGTIRGTSGQGVYLYSGTVMNSGLIAGGTSALGIYIYAAGNVANLAGGTISGATGVYFYDGSYTHILSNAGTIIGSGGIAVSFDGGTNLLIDNPGAVFTGAIYGGPGAGAVMELASGASTGTIAGFGDTVTNFTSLVFDAGAAWTVGGDDAAEGLGTLVITGFTAGDTIDLTGFVATSKTFASNVLVVSDGSTTETLNIQGALSTSNFTIASDGSTGTDVTFGAGVAALVYGETIDETGIVAASETVTAGVMTLFNGGATAVGTITVGTSLSTGDFMLASANGGTGTDVIVDTVFGTYTSGVTLLTNPTTIASTAVVSNAANGGIAVTGPTGTVWTVTNLGAVTESGTDAFGISLGSGGTVVNTGIIADGAAAAGSAVYIYGPGSLTNRSTGTIAVAGGYGVRFAGAGNVVNNGTIEGGSWVIYGESLLTVTNTGVILTAGANQVAVGLRNGGFVTNSLTGTISGGDGIIVDNAGGTVDNSGTILGSPNVGAYLYAGTVTNSGLISGGGPAGVFINGAGSVTNQLGGTIAGTGGDAVRISATGNVVNNGTMLGSTQGIYGSGSLTVTNTDLIASTGNAGDGIKLAGGGLVTNSLGGSITGQAGIFIDGGAGTVDNSGTVLGTSGAAIYVLTGTVTNSGLVAGGGGIYVADAGSITNLSTGTISGSPGVEFRGPFTETLTNAGTIIGNGGPAVYFGGTGTHVLIVDPGAVFIGQVYGGRADTTKAVMELASGGGAGTISGFGGAITNFASLVFDAGAQWTVSGDDGAEGLGTLAISGFTTGDTIDLTGFVAVSKTFASNALVLSDGSTSETLNIQGAFSTSNFLLTSDDDGGTDVTFQLAPAVVTGTLANIGMANETPSTPFAALTVTDEVGSSDTVTITLSNPAFGTLSNLDGGSFDGTTGVYTVAGTPGAVSTAIDGLVLTPASPEPQVYVTSTTLTVDVIGPGGGPAALTAIAGSAQQVLGLASVPANLLTISVSSDGTGFAGAIGGDTNEAVVTSPTGSDTYTLPTGYQAEFLGGSANATLQDTGVGDAVLVGNTGNDVLIGGGANDSIVAGNGNNTLEGGTGAIALVVGDGNDSITTSTNSTYSVALGSGSDTFFVSSSGTVTGGTGSDLIDATGAGASLMDTIVLQGVQGTVLGGAGALTVLDDGAHDTIQAGSGTTTETLNGSLDRTRGGTGSFTVDDVTASNTVIGGTAGTMFVTVGAAASDGDVFGRAGNTHILDLGADALIGAGGGTSVVSIGGAGTQVYGASPPGGTLNVSIGAANALVFGLGDNTTVDASNAAATGAVVFGGFSSIAADNGSLLIQGGVDSLVAITGGSNATINAGSGALYAYIGTGSIAGSNVINGASASQLYVAFLGGAGSATVYGGEAGASVFGVDGSDVTYVDTLAGAHGGFLVANGSAAGGETLNAAGSATNDSLFAAQGNVSLVAGTGTDFLDAGANTGSVGGAGTVVGGDTMVAGGGSDLIFFSHAAFEGGAVIINFSSLSDTVILSGYNSVAGGNQASMALADATTAGGDTTIALADGTHITFVEATTAQLQGHVFST